MSLSRVWAIVLRQLYLMKGSPSRLMPLFLWVAIDIVLWGFISRFLNSVSHSGLNFVPTLLGAVLLWDFFARVMQGVTIAFFEDIWSRNFLNLFCSPLSVPEYVAGLVVTSIATSLVGLLVMLLMSSLIFGLSFFSYGLALIPFLLVLFVFGIALGIFACGIVLQLGPSAEWFIWPIPGMLSPFAGVFYPLATLPQWMQWIAHLLPPSYVFEGMRAVVAGGGAQTGELGIAASLVLVYLLGACWFFTTIYRRSVRSGRLARYNAEGAG